MVIINKTLEKKLFLLIVLFNLSIGIFLIFFNNLVETSALQLIGGAILFLGLSIFSIITLGKKNKNDEIGEEVKIASEEFMKFTKRKRAHFINSLSGFKPINLIGTINSKNETNLSIVSSTFHIGSDPALIGFIVRPDTSPRHTLDNIRENKSFTINHVNSDIFKKAHQTSARYERDQSEFKNCGLSEIFKDQFLAPFVKESNISMSLILKREIKIEENGTHMIIGKIENVYLPENSMSIDGYIRIENSKSICLSGLDSYHETQLIDRLSYAKPFKTLESIK